MKNEQSFNLLSWIDARFPLSDTWNRHMGRYYTPVNFNFWYYFGVLSLLMLVIQIVSGIFLAMHYKPSAVEAFASVEYIMRDVSWGWLIRYLHAVGASFFFLVVYLHMWRGLIYGSYKRPRELIWLIGMVIYVVLMAEAFMGYLLPWGQTSFWGAQVIISLFGSIPYIGETLALWIRGDYVVSDATLNRFFALHVVALPLLLLLLAFLHVVALHHVGSNNPDGVDAKAHKDSKGEPLDAVPFHPYFTVKDLYGMSIFLLFYAAVVFFMPEMGGFFLEPENFIAANPLITPEHIVPLWYFTPFYAILRAVPDRFLGVLLMGAAILVLFFLPWLDRNNVRSVRYRSGAYKLALLVFGVSFLLLGWLGTQPPTPFLTALARLFSGLYFGFFVALWWISSHERVQPLPQRPRF